MRLKCYITVISIAIFSVLPFVAVAQWVSVTENVLPVKIAISPDYHLDQTVYMIDEGRRLLISETGGAGWVTLYQAANPQDPSQALLDVVVSPNFRNDNAIVRIHKDGTAKLSFDRGQQWITFPVPEGTTAIVFSPKVAIDYTLYCVTGAYGPADFYKSVNGGADWEKVTELALTSGFYCRLWNSSDTASTAHFAIQIDPKRVIMSADGGLTWQNAFVAAVSLEDFVFSPSFSQDQTVFAAGAADIWKNTGGGNEFSWVKVQDFTGTERIRVAISPTYLQDRTLLAAVDKVGIIRSVDGGMTFSDFSDGFLSTLPVSIAISQVQPAVIFAGTQGPGGSPGRLYKYQTALGIPDDRDGVPLKMSVHPNPARDKAGIVFHISESGPAKLEIIDLQGRTRAVLVDGPLGKGYHRVNFDVTDHGLRPGIYHAFLKSGTQYGSFKIVLVR